MGKKDSRTGFPRWKLKTDLVEVADGGEGDGLVEQQGGDADHAHTDPDDGEGHLGALLCPEVRGIIYEEKLSIKLSHYFCLDVRRAFYTFYF